MKRKRFFGKIALALSTLMLIASGVMFVHSATQQSASTSLSVTFSGENVDFTAYGWYQVKNTASHPYLVNGNGTEGITIHATDASTTTTLNTPANTSVELTASNTYVLFTYKFTNTASNGAFGMNVSLTGSTPQNSNIDVKYLVSSADATDYYSSSDTDNEKISDLETKVGYVTGTTAFSNVFIKAGYHKYFYILVSLKDNTLSGTYNNTLSWSVVCSDKTEEATIIDLSYFDTTNNQITGVATGKTLPSKVILPDDGSVISIANEAFKNNTDMTSLTIPASVVSIGEGAFSGCSALTEITLSGNNKQFDANAFYGCTSLVKVDCSSIQQYLTYTYQTADSNPLIYAGNLYAGGTLVNSISTSSAIKDYAFCGCTSITSLAISSVTSIGNMAFYFCSNLSGTITLTSVATISNSCFMGCSRITGVVIGDSLAVVSSYAFDNCTSLESVSIGTGLTNINSFAFAFTSTLASFTVNCSSEPTVSSEAFFQSHINAITSHPNY